MERASLVCVTCKIRKKACDKRLPSCEYCAKRGLVCTYNDAATKDVNGTSAFLSNAPPSIANQPYFQAFQILWGSLSSPQGLDSYTFNGIINLHVQHVLKLTDHSVHEITQQYFRHFHRIFPIVSPATFQSELEMGLSGTPTAGLSLILYAMCLTTLDPQESQAPATPEAIYYDLKALLVQAQSLEAPSIRQVQAYLLLTTYEYIRGHTQLAFLSIGVCNRLATLAGIRDYESIRQQYGSVSASEEAWNVWWAIVILERLIACDLPLGQQLCWSELPTAKVPLPLNLPANFPGVAPVKNLHNGSDFSRQAQAASLTDRLLQINNVSFDKDRRSLELGELDREIQSFMAIIMNESGPTEGLHCAEMAMCSRTLFCLHHHAFEGDAEILSKQTSVAALDTITKILIDMAHDHLKHVVPYSLDALPLCGRYNLDAALHHLEIRGSFSNGDVGALQALKGAYEHRWPSVEG